MAPPRTTPGDTRSLERFSARTFRQPFHSDETRRHPPSRRRRHRATKIGQLRSSLVIRRLQRTTPNRFPVRTFLPDNHVVTDKIIKARPRHRFTARTMEKLIPTTASTSHHHVRRPQRRHTPVSECSRGGFHFIAASPVLLSQQPRLPHRVPSRDASKDLQLPLHPPSLASTETRHNNNNYKLQQSTKLPRGHIRASKDYNGCPRSLLSLKSLFTPLFFFY